MSHRQYIITLDRVRCIVGLSPNVIDDKLAPAHDRAHMQCRERLGSTRYDALIAALEADSSLAGSGNEKWRNLIASGKGELENYIAWLTYSFSLPRLHSEADAAGFFAKNGGQFDSIDGKTLSMHSTDARDAYQLYERALLKWIEDNEKTEALPDVENPTDSDAEPNVSGLVAVPSRYYNYFDESSEQC